MLLLALVLQRNLDTIVRVEFVFFFAHPAPTEIYTLSLHDALPISIRWFRPDGTVHWAGPGRATRRATPDRDRKSTRLNSSHVSISYAVFCLKKKINIYVCSYLNKKKK